MISQKLLQLLSIITISSSSAAIIAANHEPNSKIESATIPKLSADVFTVPADYLVSDSWYSSRYGTLIDNDQFFDWTTKAKTFDEFLDTYHQIQFVGNIYVGRLDDFNEWPEPDHRAAWGNYWENPIVTTRVVHSETGSYAMADFDWDTHGEDGVTYFAFNFDQNGNFIKLNASGFFRGNFYNAVKIDITAITFAP